MILHPFMVAWERIPGGYCHGRENFPYGSRIMMRDADDKE